MFVVRGPCERADPRTDTGEVDVASSPRLEEALDLLDGPLDVDCSQLEFIDASGLGVLARAACTHGSVRLRNPRDMVVRVVEIAGLDEVLTIERGPESSD